MDWDEFGATIGKTEETILNQFLCSLVSAICPFKLIFQVLFWHLGTQRTAQETTNTKKWNLPTVIWNPPDLKTCSCRRYQACQSHKGPTPSLSSLPHRSLRCLWELWDLRDLRCLWCLQQWRSQRQQSMKRETKGAWIDEEQKTDHERWREKSTSFPTWIFGLGWIWGNVRAIGKTKETILNQFLCSLVSATWVCIWSNLQYISGILFWHFCTQRTAQETTNTKRCNLPPVIWNPPDLKTCSCRRYQACQSHKGPTPSLSSLPHRSLRCLWELWDLRCLWCLRWFWRLRHFHLQQWRSQRQQESMKRETKGAWIDEEQKTDHERWREKSTSFHFHGSMDWDEFGATIGKTREKILNQFLCSLVSATWVCIWSNSYFRSFSDIWAPKGLQKNQQIPNNGIYPQSSEIRQTSKHVPAGDIKHVKATKVPPFPYLPCPIGPCGAFGSSGTSGAFGAFGGFGASGTSTCSSGAHNASRSQWNRKRRVPELMKSKRQTMKDGGRNPLHSIFMDLWIGMDLGQQ